MAATELPMITVHSDEYLPVKFGPKGSAGISEIIELNDGTQLVYIGPVEDLEWLVHPKAGDDL